ncbi:hypothetical protein ODZ84_01185 [Chryseobacterium fluminis]|uniref:hypothetical protein n=1 Tax=Chryseobacterium fluminis TaxID=2983606 RepID=UPI00225B2F0B|nr:hypothetical protein [Chryseobacterium sp. MMS21-Ot14]UZT98216.1 hypothetical protein ODZ84_01185 [Chryseobacterium sp. MMS21-Ot14]
MFEFFKRKKEYKFEDREICFFKNIINVLPKRYLYLEKQLTKDFILGWKPNPLGYENSYTFLLNAALEKKFERKNFPQFFIIQNIEVWEKTLSKFVSIELDILTGFFGGFKSESIAFENFDFTKINLSKLNEKHFRNQDKDELLEIIGKLNKDQLSKLDIDDAFKIEIPEGVFYTIKILGDGDYLAVDSKGTVYELLHDPYIVKKRASNIQELLQ